MAIRTLSGGQVAILLRNHRWASPTYRDLAEQLRLLIVDGRIPNDTRLPSERTLAGSLRLSRSTVTAAYAELRDRGQLEARRGSGHYAVAKRVPVLGMLHSQPPDEKLIDLSRAAPIGSPELLCAYERVIDRLPAQLATTGYDPFGSLELRMVLADRFTARGLPTDPDQLIITTGAQAALAVVGRSLLDTGDRMLVEAPSYPNALDTFRQHGIRLISHPVTDSGWDVEAVEQTVRQTSPRVAYFIPDFHNPTGQLMPTEQRSRIRELLDRHRVTMIIDETMSELSLSDEPAMPPMAAGSATAITVGSASKSLWGGLRVGWIRAPRSLIQPLVRTRIALDLGSAPFEQLVTADLLQDPTDLMAGRRRLLRRQRDRLAAELSDRFPDWSWRMPSGGLLLWVLLPTEVSGRLAMAAEDYGLMLTPGSQFFPDGGGERRLRIAYTLGEEILTEAVDRLARLWADVGTLRGRPTGLSLTA